VVATVVMGVTMVLEGQLLEDIQGGEIQEEDIQEEGLQEAVTVVEDPQEAVSDLPV
jgi:hypothetical protein